MHYEVKFRVVVLYCLNQTFYNNLRFQFFPYFTLQCLFRRFPGFHFAPRKLPTILVIPVPSLSGKDTAFVIMYDCCYDFYLFHVLTTFCCNRYCYWLFIPLPSDIIRLTSPVLQPDVVQRERYRLQRLFTL